MAASTVGLAVLDREGVVRSANPALFRLTGLTRGQLVRRPLLDVVAHDESGRLAQWLDDPHTACVVDLQIEPPDAEPVRLAGWVNPLAPGEGDPDDHAVIQLVPREVDAGIARAARRFDAIVDDLSDAVVITDPDLKVLEANRAALSLFDDLAVGGPLLEAIDTGHHAAFAAAIRTGARGGVSFDIEVDGAAVQVTARELRDSVGQLVGVAFALSSSGTPGRAEEPDAESVRPAQPRTSVAGPTEPANPAIEVVWTLDHDGVTGANGAALELLGLAPDADLQDISLLTIFTAESARQLVSDGLADLAPGGSWEADLTIIEADGGQHHVATLLRHHPAEDAADNETWSITAELPLSASTPAPAPTTDGPLRDPATGLPTEAVLRDRLETSIDRSIRTGRRTCLVVLAVDGFEELAPTIGDEVAEDLLHSIADVLSQQLRPGDTLARTQRAQFEALRDDVTDLRDAERFAERLRVSLDDPVIVDGVRWYVSLSAGVALTQPGVTTVAGLRRNGHAALEQAARIGGAHTVMFGRALSDGARSAPARNPGTAGSSRPRNPTRTTHQRGQAEEPPSEVKP